MNKAIQSYGLKLRQSVGTIRLYVLPCWSSREDEYRGSVRAKRVVEGKNRATSKRFRHAL